MENKDNELFDFERLTVYQMASDYAVMADAIVRTIPFRKRAMRDQLERSSLSIVLNIAEGAGEFSPKEKARFYRMARRSATESHAVAWHAYRLKFITLEEATASRKQVMSMVKMLTSMVLKLDRPNP